MDLVIHAERIPLSGETVPGSGYDESLGGKGANQAVGVAQLGYKTRMIGRVGTDDYGQRLLAGVAEAGVDISGVSVTDGPSGLAVITHAGGANSIVVIAGANDHLGAAEVEQASALIQSASVLLLQLETPIDAVIRAAEIACEAGVPVILDPAPARDLPPELVAMITWLTPNETEASRLLHKSQELSPEDAASKLLKLGARNVVLKRGEHGCFLKGADCSAGLAVPAFPSKVVDTTAAGDCFNAAFATQLALGTTPQEAAVYACAAASIAVSRPGAQASMPRADEVEQILTANQARS